MVGSRACEEGLGDDRIRFNGKGWVAVSTTVVGGAAGQGVGLVTRVRVAQGRRTCRLNEALLREFLGRSLLTGGHHAHIALKDP